MKIAITAESAIDLPKDLLKEYEIQTAPFTILLGEQVVMEGEISNEELFDYVSKTKTLPKTSAVNEHQYTEMFEQVLKQNDAIIHFSMSSKGSCAYNNAVMASKKFDNVYVIDTKSYSIGIALVAIKAKKLVEQGKSLKYILEKINETVPKVQTSLIINRLDYLRKGGRCSGIALLGANLLHLRPQIIGKDGKLVAGKKYRGNFDKCVENYCNDTLKQHNKFDNSLAFVAYTTVSENVKEIAVASLKKAGFKQIICTPAGATISSHCGPNALGILYLTI